jgi:hypothetical protein
VGIDSHGVRAVAALKHGARPIRAVGLLSFPTATEPWPH